MAITTKSLPDQIPPQASPFVYDDGTGELRLEIHWYLFLYHMWTVFSSSQGAFVLAQDVLLQDPAAASSGGLPTTGPDGTALTAGVTGTGVVAWTSIEPQQHTLLGGL